MAKINEYPQAATINNNDLFVIDQQSGGDHATKSATMAQLTDKATSGVQTQIGSLSQLTTSDKSSLVGAVNEVNTGLGNTYTKNDIDSYNVRKYTTSWGKTCQTTLGRYQFIVLRGFTPYVVWLASTNDINVANIASNTSANGTGSVTFDNVVFTRLSNNNLKVELPSNGTITIFG